MITGSISVNDYMQAQRLHRKSFAKWSNISAAVIAACGVVMLMAGPRQFGVIALFTGVGAFLGEYFVAYIYLPRKVKKLHTQQKALTSQFTYSWDTQHIEAQSSTGSSRRPWDHYAKVKEDENIFLLYHADNMFEMLPKSWFPSSEAIDEFRKLALRTPEA
jgi:hypothetical protein